MKIGEAARETGLSEKAIRVYVENGLVKPEVTQSLHRNSYEFTRENVKQLEQIAVFRKAGFSLFEISIIQEQPQRLPELLESKRQSLELDISAQSGVREALERMQASEVGNVDKVTRNLRYAVANQKVKKKDGSRRWIIVAVTVLIVNAVCLWVHYIGICNRSGFFVKLLPSEEKTIAGAILLALSLPCLYMAMRYATCPRRSRRLPRHGAGTVTHVMEEHGFDGRFARAGSGSAGTREPGIGGMWQIHFMLWNEVRPDCWYPVIRYRDETGKERSNTFDYGGFRHSWNVGETVEIAWNPGYPGYIYPLAGKWLKQKAMLYGLVGLALAIAGVTLILLAAPEASEALRMIE